MVFSSTQSYHYHSPGSHCSRSIQSLAGSLPPGPDPQTVASPGSLTGRCALDHCCLKIQRHTENIAKSSVRVECISIGHFMPSLDSDSGVSEVLPMSLSLVSQILCLMYHVTMS